jgi:hypothetical protein
MRLAVFTVVLLNQGKTCRMAAGIDVLNQHECANFFAGSDLETAVPAGRATGPRHATVIVAKRGR